LLAENKAEEVSALEVNGKGHKHNDKQALANSAKGKVPAVTRAIAILRYLGRSPEPLGVNKIARELGLIPSTALHILRALMAEEMVSFDEQTKQYELDVGVLTLAGSAVRRNSFIKSVQPGLDRLSDKFGLTMLAAKIMGLDHAIVVAISLSSLPVRLHTELGSRFPALISGTGRCLAAFGDFRKAELSKRFSRLNWAKPISFNQWWEQVEQTKLSGYGVDEGNFLAGVTVIAVPVFEAGCMTHSIVAVGLHEQIADMGIARIAKEIQQVAEELSSDAI